MTPSMQPDAPAIALPVETEILGEGEEIILAVKPSGWFILVVSWPVLALAAVAAAMAVLIGQAFRLPQQSVQLVCLAVTAGRIIMACFQWAAHVYVLTNLRVLHIRGTTQPEVTGCLLKSVREVRLLATLWEKMLGVGNLSFVSGETGYQRVNWTCVARPRRVRQRVHEAISRLK